MHKVYDENGNLIPHGAHGEEHHHDHHCQEGQEKKEENLVLLTYMHQHNEQHTAELEEMVQKLETAGYGEEADEIRKGVASFQEGNAHLGQALEQLKKKIMG